MFFLYLSLNTWPTCFSSIFCVFCLVYVVHHVIQRIKKEADKQSPNLRGEDVVFSLCYAFKDEHLFARALAHPFICTCFAVCGPFHRSHSMFPSVRYSVVEET